MELIYILLGLGWGLSLVGADVFHIIHRAVESTISVSELTPSATIPEDPCRACTLDVAAGEVQAAPAFAFDTTGIDEATTYLNFTAYRVISDSPSGTTRCILTTGTPITLPTPFSITKAAGVDSSSFSTSAASQFLDFLGFTDCLNGASSAEVKGLLPQTNSTTPPKSSTSPTLTPKVSVSTPHSSHVSSTVQSLSSAPISNSKISAASTSPALKTSQSNLTTRNKIAIGIAIPIVVLGAFLLAFLVLRRRHRKRAKAGEKSTAPSHDDTQPYLQAKGELEAEEKRRYELHAQDIRYEVPGQDQIHEVAEHGTMEGLTRPSPSRTQELWSEECAKELDEAAMKIEDRKSGTSSEIKRLET